MTVHTELETGTSRPFKDTEEEEGIVNNLLIYLLII